MAGTSFSEAATRSTAQRLRRTRQHLGTYRHDLLVAMRVVNSVEREMVRAEWENWLLDENTRCRQVQILLRENRTSTPTSTGKRGKKAKKVADAQRVMDTKERERAAKLDGLRLWHEDYCGSCKREQELLQTGRKHIAFA